MFLGKISQTTDKSAERLSAFKHYDGGVTILGISIAAWTNRIN